MLHSALQCLINGHLWDVPKLLASPAAVQLAVALAMRIRMGVNSEAAMLCT